MSHKTTDVSPYPMEIGRVPKTKKDTYIVSVNEYNGKKYVDVRLHVNIDGGDTLPTKKGITLNLRTFEPVAKLLVEAYKVLQEMEGTAEESEKVNDLPEG